ncbi:MAG: Gluconolactonase [Paracidovorax wautersii]|uniref:Gluconolactonase n=1 Tax=Paracidovorax wautersii TaxID=1177982 RepID=A0A7V8JQQ3_9BURK|nr:MAG: Gluconolactonase [Paracidovorax wautersii]
MNERIAMSYFPAPPERQARVFARLPEAFRTPRTNEWTRFNARGRALHSLLEGPAFDAQGNLYVTDVPFGRIFRIDGQGNWSLVAEYDGWPNGLKIGPDGRIYIADYKRGLLELDPVAGRVHVLAARYLSEGFKGINDLCLTPEGDILFTDQGQTGLQDASGRVFRWSAQGRLTRVLDGIPSPNGIAYDAAERILYVAVTRAQQIWRIPLHEDDQIGKAGVFAQLHGGPGGPDGIVLDGQGGLLVAHAGVGTVWHLDALARPRARIQSPAGLVVTNLAFSADGRLFVTEAQDAVVLEVAIGP